MRIAIIAKPGAKETKVEKIFLSTDPGQVIYKVSVKEPAKEGRANWAIERVLAKYFNVSPAQVQIIGGQTSRNKIIEIKNEE